MANALLIAGAAGYSAFATDQAGRKQRKLANRNADNLDAAATDVISRGEEEAMAIRKRGKGIRGAQRAKLASSGLDIGSGGTAQDLQDETTAMTQQDEATTRKNAFREAWGIKTQASYSREAGKYARQASLYSAGGQILGGAGEAYRGYYAYDAPTVQGSGKGGGGAAGANYGPSGKQKNGGYFGALYGEE